MRKSNFKNLLYLNSSNPNLAVKEVRKIIAKSEISDIAIDLSDMNVIDAVKVLVMTSSYLYKKQPDEKLKFKFSSGDINNIISVLALKNLEFVA